MSTPVINAINNVNDSTLNSLFQAVANNASARESLSQSNRNVDAVTSNLPALRGLGDNAGQDEAIRLCLCRRSGRDPANFPNTATDIIQDGTFRGEILADSILSALLSASQPGMAEIASSATFSSELAASQTAMQEVAASQTAMQEVAASQTAMQEVAASQTALDEVTASATARGEIIPSATAMGEMAASATAMSVVASDATFMSELAADATGMAEVAASQTAMQEVANSQTAMTEVLSTDATVEGVMSNTLANSSTAEAVLDNSSLVVTKSGFFDNAFRNAAGTLITNRRSLVVSNNSTANISSVNGINYNISYGSKHQSDTTFVVNDAEIQNNSPNTGEGGSMDIRVIEP